MVLYKEVEMLLPLNSKYTKKVLEKRSKLIKVMRHNSWLFSPWTHHEKMVVIDQQVAFVGGLDITFGRWDKHSHPISDLPNEKQEVAFPGPDYCNARICDNGGMCNKCSLDRNSQPRMPWHDMMVMVKGKVVKDLVWHFVQCWDHVKREISSGGRLHAIKKKGRGEKLKEAILERKAVQKEDFDYPVPLCKCSGNRDDDPSFFNTRTCQVLRTACKWSVGLPVIETSIHKAYVGLIESAKQYVYIENQYFISNDGTSECLVKNQVANAIFTRIKKAHKNGEKFRVFIIIPLYPEIKGDIEDQNQSAAVRAILRYEQLTIGQGENSLFGRLAKEGINPDEHIGVFGLRGHAKVGPMTEMVYVHSKIMIVDDRSVVVGSANINDRSLIGGGDSELSMLVNADAVGSLRIALMKEHLSCSEAELSDPLSDKLWTKIKSQARKNTELYREIFNCDPDDTIKNMADLRKARERASATKPEEKLQKYESLWRNPRPYRGMANVVHARRRIGIGLALR